MTGLYFLYPCAWVKLKEFWPRSREQKWLCQLQTRAFNCQCETSNLSLLLRGNQQCHCAFRTRTSPTGQVGGSAHHLFSQGLQQVKWVSSLLLTPSNLCSCLEQYGEEDSEALTGIRREEWGDLLVLAAMREGRIPAYTQRIDLIKNWRFFSPKLCLVCFPFVLTTLALTVSHLNFCGVYHGLLSLAGPNFQFLSPQHC